MNATHPIPARQHAAPQLPQFGECEAEALRGGQTVTIGRLQFAVVDQADDKLLQITLGSRSSTYALDVLEAELEALSAA